MLSYMLPVEEKSQNTRTVNLNLNLQNTTQSLNKTEIDHLESEDVIDENTKLLKLERKDYLQENLNGSLIKNGSNKTNYNMNITNNNLYNNNLINTNHNNNNSTIKHGDMILGRDEAESQMVAINENSVNNNDETSSSGDKKIIKMTKLGSKNVNLKRVSFGSSKGSMVETLIFETPTPLPEHAEREFFPSTDKSETETNENGLDDSGIELQEELERSKVRVTFFQSSKPQQISPPSSDNQFYFGDNYFNNNSLIDSFLQNSSISETDSKMTTVILPDFDRQISTDSGWDNPFRPDGDLSREADEIVNLIKGGKPITPTGEQLLLNGSPTNGIQNGITVLDGATKLEVSPLLNQSNGTKSPQKSATVNGDAKKDQQPHVSNQTVPGPQSANCVVIDEKKKKGSKCCVIQ